MSNKKTIISSDNKIRDVWYNLVQVIKPFKVIERDLEYFQINGKDKAVIYPMGTYLIECQTNKMFARTNYKEISKEDANKLIAETDIEKAIETMQKYFA